MKVTHRKHCEPAVEYRKVKRGEVFMVPKYGTEIYIKTDFSGFSGAAAVKLSTGETYSYTDNTMVQLVNCEVVVG